MKVAEECGRSNCLKKDIAKTVLAAKHDFYWN
jgi:hypothetical protein